MQDTDSYSNSDSESLGEFYLNKILVNLDDEYKEIEIVFRRSFPFGYPGRDGNRTISHNWKIRCGDTYYQYQICRYCFDVRKLQSTNSYEKIVQTCLCASCGANPTKSRNYWDAIYATLCTCPVLGDRFEHCMAWKLPRIGIHSWVSKVGSIQRDSKIQEGIRDYSPVEQISSSSESDSTSYIVQTL